MRFQRLGVRNVTLNSLDCRGERDGRAIRQQLDRILTSGPFVQSQRRQRFLEYIVHETLAGRGERLKGYSIALEVFGRPDTFDPIVDPIVRIEAGRLRDKLRHYYDTEGMSDPIRIELPRGGYRPRIAFRDPGDGASSHFPRTHERLRRRMRYSRGWGGFGTTHARLAPRPSIISHRPWISIHSTPLRMRGLHARMSGNAA